MARKRVESWVVTDEFWQRVEALIPERAPQPDKTYLRKPGAGRPPKPARQVFEAIVYVLRTGCQWNALRETGLCSSSSAHRRFQEWVQAGVFTAFWRRGLLAYDAVSGIDWTWMALDGAMGKAPLGGGKNRPQPDRPRQARGEALGAH